MAELLSLAPDPTVLEIEASSLQVDEWFALRVMNAVKPLPDNPTEQADAFAAKLEAEELLQRGDRAQQLARFLIGVELLEARGALQIVRDPAGNPIRDEAGELTVRSRKFKVISRLVNLARGTPKHLKDLKIGDEGSEL